MSESRLPNARNVSGSAGEGPDGPAEVRIVGGVSLETRQVADTDDQALWSRLRTSSELLSFTHYESFIDSAFCALRGGKDDDRLGRARIPAPLPFPDVQSYRALKAATEVFMELACGTAVNDDWEHAFARDESRLRLDLGDRTGPEVLKGLWDSYVADEDGRMEVPDVIPYLIEVRGNLKGTGFRTGEFAEGTDVELCEFLIAEKFQYPCLIELIWSYWHEEGMLVRSIGAVSRRFQNRGTGMGRDPLTELEITALRPLNNLLWGYIQDAQHRLTPERRLYEYDHHYGLRTSGARSLRPADSRSRFLSAFHALVEKCATFFKEDDDATITADGFPVLNALREVHILLAEGAHNQFGDLPWTSRLEMLMEQWLLARPEFDEFLPSRKSVVFPERWMHRVEALKRLHRWDQPSVRHFNNLARYGELLLLSIRYGNWAVVDEIDSARNWARFFRQEMQWYIHSYQAVTGVDLASGMVDVRPAGAPVDRAAQPGTLMRARRAALGPGAVGQPVRPPARRRELRP